MYKKSEQQVTFEEFRLSYGGDLNSQNRWVQLSRIIPWHKIEERYASNFASGLGPRAKSVRMALGALLIKERCGFTDEETVLHIQENSYMQYFIGLPRHEHVAPFDPSMMVHFRKRFSAEVLMEINELICLGDKTEDEDKKDKNSDVEAGTNAETDTETNSSSGESDAERKIENKGTLIADATCAPADIRFPTDLGLLNEAREKLEGMIDTLHEPMIGKARKPRNYRKVARRDYLNATKNKKLKKKVLRKAIGKQLRYVERDLKIVKQLMDNEESGPLGPRQSQTLETIETLYQQQKTMFEKKTHRIEDRIVSISQPHVRPIVRGKAAASTEFGAKLTISMHNGFSFLDKLSWDNFNEGVDLIEQIENYKRRFGVYPEVVLVDKIFRNRMNISYCKAHNIRLSGPPLGRPNAKLQKEQKKLERRDNGVRNAVEGKIGEGKRRYRLGRIMAKLQETSESVIVLQFLVMNLEQKLRLLFVCFKELIHFAVYALFGRLRAEFQIY